MRSSVEVFFFQHLSLHSSVLAAAEKLLDLFGICCFHSSSQTLLLSFGCQCCYVLLCRGLGLKENPAYTAQAYNIQEIVWGLLYTHVFVCLNQKPTTALGRLFLLGSHHHHHHEQHYHHHHLVIIIMVHNDIESGFCFGPCQAHCCWRNFVQKENQQNNNKKIYAYLFCLLLIYQTCAFTCN